MAAKIGADATPPPRKEDWSRPGRFDELMPHLQRFEMPYVDAQALIVETPEFWEYPMCDRDPLPRWSHGRVTLLGDAAHPMYPVGSNGASQAILDARCLADRLRTAEHPLHALWEYEQERLPITAQIVRMNRKGGPEGVIDAVEERAPDGFGEYRRRAVLRGAQGDRARLCLDRRICARAGQPAGREGGVIASPRKWDHVSASLLHGFALRRVSFRPRDVATEPDPVHRAGCDTCKSERGNDGCPLRDDKYESASPAAAGT